MRTIGYALIAALGLSDSSVAPTSDQVHRLDMVRRLEVIEAQRAAAQARLRPRPEVYADLFDVRPTAVMHAERRWAAARREAGIDAGGSRTRAIAARRARVDRWRAETQSLQFKHVPH